ncbi:hypothetical protein AZI87_14505 [Bdellovibrio bacteriovorus]|uniref:DUF4105 domain-containing protein n=1 Tax=Bdellovibrio bacteriovorus TaxID=959 RepID=A0A161PAV6_BDEBC|nr:hypothetical protein [Bdellovibrio bacteriovorus]KYG63604.1 hypothetical protein AZI87_14505 [Bdellovibrio bacteriovorus]
MKPSGLLFFLLLFSPLAFAQTLSLTAPNKSCACSSEIEDPLEEPQSFNYGKFQGQCIDSCRFRPARILESSSHLIVGNILHLGGYYKASIPLQNLAKVEMGFEEFLPGVSHVVLKFTLDEKAPDIILLSQVNQQKAAIPIRSLVLSSEGVPPKDHPYTLMEAYFGNFLLAHRLVTGDEFARWIAEYAHPLKLVELKIPTETAGKIFLKGVQQSDTQRMQDVYALFSNNCSTSAFSFIDSQSNITRTGWQRFLDALPIAGPWGTLQSLQERQLVNQ